MARAHILKIRRWSTTSKILNVRARLYRKI